MEPIRNDQERASTIMAELRALMAKTIENGATQVEELVAAKKAREILGCIRQGASAAGALAKKLDRDWFEANPHRRYRLRYAIPDELPDVHAGFYVLVRQSVPGVRFRWPFLPDRPLPTSEASEEFAKRVFELLIQPALPRPWKGVTV